MSNIVITGATGYIGSNLARRLLRDGHDVHALVRSSSNFGLLGETKDNSHLHIHVITGDTAELTALFRDIEPQAVFHLASLFKTEHEDTDIEQLVASNVLFGTQLLNASAKSGVNCFINTGTCWQNFEGKAYNPVNLYAATKEALEAVAKYFTETSELKMLTVKLTDTYGPFDPRKKVMQIFKRASATHERLDMSPGEQEMSLVYIDDVVEGFARALEFALNMSQHEYKCCTLQSSEVKTLKEVAAVFGEAYGVVLDINFGGRGYKKREMMCVADSDFNILEGRQRYSLFDGIKRMKEMEEMYDKSNQLILI